MPKPKPFQAGEPLSASKLNLIVAEVLRLGRWRATAPLLLKDDADGLHLRLGANPVHEWFYTTAAVPTATASATGTSIGSATTTMGKATARRCLESVDGSGNVSRVPDPNALDVTIHNPFVYTTQIATGSLVRCIRVKNRWEVEAVVRCPGT